MRWSRVLWLLSVLTWVVYLGVTFSSLPQSIETSWDLQGRPRDWTDKTTFLVVFSAGALLANLIFLALSGSWMRKIPESLVNLPWKSYWFATPARKETAFSKLQDLMAFTGIFLNLLLLLVVQATMQSNLKPPPFTISTQTSISLIAVASLGVCILPFLLLKPPRR